MAHFYGTLQGNRGEATRCGSKGSGMVAYAASWEGAVRVEVWHNAKKGCDYATVTLTPWRGGGTHKDLYFGPVSGEEQEREAKPDA